MKPSELELDPTPVLPSYVGEVAFWRLDGEDGQMRATATGSQTFVTRVIEAVASAFEEEATR